MFLPDLVTLFAAPFLKPFMVTSSAAPDSATEEIYMSVILTYLQQYLALNLFNLIFAYLI